MARIPILTTAAKATGRYYDVVCRHGARADAVRTVDALPEDQPERTTMYMLSTRLAPSARPAIALVDNNTSHAVPHLLRALGDVEGATPADVRWIIVTHAHLDHCAGTGTLLKECHNATVICHPRARKHLVDPTALLRSARGVYKDAFEAQVGNMEPCPADRVRAVADEEEIDLLDQSGGGRPLRCLFVEGHARHHIAVHDPSTASVFTGDCFGVVYNDMCDRHGLRAGTMLPATSPIDFDFKEAMAAVDRIEALPGIKHAWPTHFGPVGDIPAAAAQMRELLPRFESVRRTLSVRMQEGASPDEAQAMGQGMVDALMRSHFDSRGLRDMPDSAWQQRMGPELNINTQGLVVGARRFPVRPEEPGSKL